MENKNQAFRGEGTISDAHVFLKLSEIELYLKFDSKEEIYQLKYKTNNSSIKTFISENYDFFESLNVANRKKIFTHTYIRPPEPDTLSFVLRAFDLSFKDYIGDPGALLEQDSSVESDILCHCAKLSRSAFTKEFIKNRGDVKKTVFQTMAKSFCESCEFEVDSLLKSLELQNQFFKGQPKEVWINKIDELIEEFYLFCPADYNKLKFKVSALKYDKVIIKCDKSDSGLTRAEIQSTLSNYLTSEIDEEIVISVIT